MTDGVAQRIALLFDATFAEYHTVMRGGASEPLYRPARGADPALIIYTRDYPASALHEAAHWCLAGTRRRSLKDYGYRYVPGPRDPAARRAFFVGECEAQALEAVFAAAAGVHFVVSADDFAAPPIELDEFAMRVSRRAAALAGRLPPRAQRFHAALVDHFAGDRG
jgi:elongation factor P hydroxylase